MEFFDWMNVINFLIQYFQPIHETAEAEIAGILQANYISLGVAFGIFLIGLILGGIALRTMAKKSGQAPSALAFVPFANTWYAGKIAGEASFFGQKMKRAGLYAMLLEILYFLFELGRLVLDFFLTRPEYYTMINEGDFAYWMFNSSQVPAENLWQVQLLTYSGIISYIIWFFMLVFLVVLFMALFRKYYARRPVLMTMLSTLFPFRGFILFAVRNNDPVDYNEYLRRRMYQNGYPGPGGYGPGPGNPPAGGYGQNGPSGNGQNGPSGGPEDPFKEFGQDGQGEGPSSDDPFGDL